MGQKIFWIQEILCLKTIFLSKEFCSKCKLESCPYWTKTCPHWTYFGSNYPKNGVGLAVTLDKNFNFSKVLLSPKFNNNSIIIEVKKKILYYILYHTLERNIDPIERKVKYVVEFFFSSLPYSLNYIGIMRLLNFEKIKFFLNF